MHQWLFRCGSRSSPHEDISDGGTGRIRKILGRYGRIDRVESTGMRFRKAAEKPGCSIAGVRPDGGNGDGGARAGKSIRLVRP
jgi:hypothetical protein